MENLLRYKNNMKKILSILIIAVVIVGGYFLFNKKPNENGAGPIKIGALLSLTGGASAWGENAQKGIMLAVEEINKEGGINGREIEVVYEDTASDPKQSVSAYQHLMATEDPVALIGPLNQTETASVISLINKDEIPTFIPGFLPLQDRKDINNPIFVWTDAESESALLAQHIYEKGVRKVGVIGTQDAWENTVTMGFVNKFKALGGTITDLEIVQPTAEDMKLPATKVVASKPEAIYLGTYYQFVNSIKEISNQGYKGELYGIEIDDYLAGETASWSNGLKFIAPDYYSEEFINKFKTRFNIAPGMPAGQSYDTVKAIYSILKKSQNKEDILSEMKNFKKYQGVSGELNITSDGKSHLPLALFVLNNGKVSRLQSLP